jgi:hypothetical protein
MTRAKQPLAVFGTGRNGRTLIARLLDGSPDLWMHPVDIVYLPIFDDLARIGRPTGPSVRTETTRRLGHLDARVAAEALVGCYRFHVEDLETVYLPRLVEERQAAGDPMAALLEHGDFAVDEFLPALLDEVRAAYDPGADPRYLAFKSSETAYIDDYLRIFPGLPCIHILRHPVSNYSSLKRTIMDSKRRPFWNEGQDLMKTFLEARWLPHARALVRLLEQEPERHVLTRYEDLCANPTGEIRRVCDRLGVAPPPEPDIQTILGGMHMSELPPNPSKPGSATPERVVRDTAAVLGYQPNVSPREEALIMRLTGGLARRLGYDEAPSVEPTLRLWLDWLPVEASERQNIGSRPRWLLQLARRRAYITRRLAAQ